MNQDRNLLFGILAVQLHKVTPGQLVEAAGAWAANPRQPLHEHLLARGALSEEDCRLVLALVATTVEAYQGNATDALEGFGGDAQVRASFGGTLERGEDGEVRAVSLRRGWEVDPVPALEETPGRYTHIGEFSRGGMGRILLTYDQYLGRDIALKELLPQPASGSGPHATPVRELMPVVHRFLQEARITGQLEHPSIVPVYELGRRRDGHLYYTMKLVRGQTLRKLLREAGSLEKRLAYLSHYESLCQAIAYAHDRRVIHRDIKPDNVMIGDFGETVVIDWGLAKVMDKEDAHADGLQRTVQAMHLAPEVDSWKTAPGEVLGTAMYMAPEQARGELDRVDTRSDVYSLGAVLYELLTGGPPFRGKSVHDIIYKVISERPPPLRQVVPDAPPELVAICERAMDPDPQRRYADASELAGEVQRFQTGALVQTYRYRFREHLIRFIRRHRPILATAAVALAALIALAGYSHARVIEERDAAEEQLYLSSMYLAREGIDNRRFDVAREALVRAPERLRRWEWGYYNRLCHLDEHTLEGHEGPVSSVEYSPDGTLLLTASDDGDARLWDAASGQLIHTLEGHEDALTAAHFSPAGKRVLTASVDGTAILWDTVSGKPIHVLEGHTGCIHAARFRPDGKAVLTASDDGTVRVWNTATGSQQLILTGHERGVRDAAFVRGGGRIVTVSLDGTSRLWEAGTGKEVASFRQGSDILSFAVGAGGDRILTEDRDRSLCLWDASSAAALASVPDPGGWAVALDLSDDGTRIVGVYGDGTVRVHNAEDGSELATLSDEAGALASARFNADGTAVIVALGDKTARMWDLSGRQAPGTLEGHSQAVLAAVFSPDGTHAATASADGTAKIWKLIPAPAHPLYTLAGHRDRIIGMSLRRDGRRLATCSDDGTVKVWDLADGRLRYTLRGKAGFLASAAFSPDGKELLVSCSDGTATLCDAERGRTLKTFAGHAGTVHTAVFDSTGERIVTGSKDRTARVWSRMGRDKPQVLRGHTDEVVGAVFNASGDRILTWSWDGTARLWDSSTGELLHTLTGHDPAAEIAGAFSPDGKRAITYSGDGIFRIWDARSGKPIAERKAHGHQVLALAFHPVSLRMATASTDGSIKLWEARTGRLIREFAGHDGSVYAVAFHPDGTRLVSAGGDGIVKVWDSGSGAELAALSMPDPQVLGAEFTPEGGRIVTISGDTAYIWSGLGTGPNAWLQTAN